MEIDGAYSGHLQYFDDCNGHGSLMMMMMIFWF